MPICPTVIQSPLGSGRLGQPNRGRGYQTRILLIALHFQTIFLGKTTLDLKVFASTGNCIIVQLHVQRVHPVRRTSHCSYSGSASPKHGERVMLIIFLIILCLCVCVCVCVSVCVCVCARMCACGAQHMMAGKFVSRKIPSHMIVRAALIPHIEDGSHNDLAKETYDLLLDFVLAVISQGCGRVELMCAWMIRTLSLSDTF